MQQYRSAFFKFWTLLLLLFAVTFNAYAAQDLSIAERAEAIAESVANLDESFSHQRFFLVVSQKINQSITKTSGLFQHSRALFLANLLKKAIELDSEHEGDLENLQTSIKDFIDLLSKTDSDKKIDARNNKKDDSTFKSSKLELRKLFLHGAILGLAEFLRDNAQLLPEDFAFNLYRGLKIDYLLKDLSAEFHGKSFIEYMVLTRLRAREEVKRRAETGEDLSPLPKVEKRKPSFRIRRTSTASSHLTSSSSEEEVPRLMLAARAALAMENAVFAEPALEIVSQEWIDIDSLWEAIYAMHTKSVDADPFAKRRVGKQRLLSRSSSEEDSDRFLDSFAKRRITKTSELCLTGPVKELLDSYDKKVQEAEEHKVKLAAGSAEEAKKWFHAAACLAYEECESNINGNAIKLLNLPLEELRERAANKMTPPSTPQTESQRHKSSLSSINRRLSDLRLALSATPLRAQSFSPPSSPAPRTPRTAPAASGHHVVGRKTMAAKISEAAN